MQFNILSILVLLLSVEISTLFDIATLKIDIISVEADTKYLLNTGDRFRKTEFMKYIAIWSVLSSHSI